MFDHIHEECGVFGIFAPQKQNVASTAYYALFALQHRGQESAGIVVNDDGVFTAHKDAGLVNDVFTPEVMARLGEGNMAVGHVRYGTTGRGGRENAQPIVVNHLKGNMALAHNGNLTNAYELRSALEDEGSIFHTTTDSEVIAYVITKERVKKRSIEAAVVSAMDKLKGAYSLVVMSPSKLIAARDPQGFRPLCLGKRDDGAYIVASESCALNAVGALSEKTGWRAISRTAAGRSHSACLNISIRRVPIRRSTAVMCTTQENARARFLRINTGSTRTS